MFNWISCTQSELPYILLFRPYSKGDVRIYVKRHRPGRRLFGSDTAMTYKYYIHVISTLYTYNSISKFNCITFTVELFFVRQNIINKGYDSVRMSRWTTNYKSSLILLFTILILFLSFLFVSVWRAKWLFIIKMAISDPLCDAIFNIVSIKTA